ncbi:MAG: 3-keto-5-aminohexanoate cleavage protein [Clostridiaceae bacterium]
MDKLVINFAPTGMVPKKSDTPHVPVSSDEIVENVYNAWKMGITIVHLHIRDEVTGEADYRKEVYGKIIRNIRAFAPELIICASTSGRKFTEFEKRAEVLDLEGDLKPDMGSLTLSSMNFISQASLNDPSVVTRLAEKMLKKGIKPELEAFDTGMINYSKYLINKGILKPPFYFNILLGSVATAQADLLHAGLMIKEAPEQSIISLSGIGNFQLPINSLAIAMGYGVRVGLEDNIWFDEERTKLASNMDLLARIHKIAEAQGREIMSSPELRERLNLKKGFGEYGTKD